MRLILLAILAALLWAVFAPDRDAGPAPDAVPVTLPQLATDPTGWDGRHVTLRGEVVGRVTVLGMGGVLIGDGRGNRIVAAGWTGAVTPGARTRITGRFRLVLAVGEVQLPLIMLTADPGNQG